VDPLGGLTRREAARLFGGTAAALCFSRTMAKAQQPADNPIMRPIPSSGEKLPVIGLGTWQTFDVDPAHSAPLAEVLRTFVKLGGRVVDSSPMYGRAEQVIGDLLTKLKLRDSLFLATKVWTRGKQAGIDSMERSFARLQTKTIDLMQVHNLVDAETQLQTMREWKAQGRFRYLGVTHYEAGAFAEVAKILAREKLDFVQINYSIMEREAEAEIFPLAQDQGVAVIVNRPFSAGDLFHRVRGKPLPDFAAELNCTSWAQFLLKWIVAHPAVTCAIPATNNVQHLEDNMHGGVGRLPDAKLRQRMIEAVSNL
jgi:diketogulonate reductase-like aldo/keto reductase